jgi:hypothetical protein
MQSQLFLTRHTYRLKDRFVIEIDSLTRQTHLVKRKYKKSTKKKVAILKILQIWKFCQRASEAAVLEKTILLARNW